MAYFDYNSTAPYSTLVRGYLEQEILQDWHNPSAIYPKAQILDQQIKECRIFIADFLNCSPKNLFFTSGGTEAINTALSSDTLRLHAVSSIISSPLEHHATLKKMEYLKALNEGKAYGEGSRPVKLYWVGNNEQGEINLLELEILCAKHPRSFISLLSANNETGVITDVKEVSRIAKKYHCLVHIDAVQSLGKTPVDLSDWDVDFVSFSGHKIGAMKGVGLFYAKKSFAPLMYGGGQEKGLRPGTYNFPAVYSLKLAVQDIDFRKWECVKQLRDYFEKSLLAGYGFATKKGLNPANAASDSTHTAHWRRERKKELNMSPFKINCQSAKRLSNTSSIYCKGISSQRILLHFAKKGICASAGSACQAGSPEPSHVITALSICDDVSARDYARNCIRISLSPSNTKEEVDFVLSAFRELYCGQREALNI